MNTIKSGDGNSFGSWKAVAILAAILCILFWRSFLPEYVHFSNDGPLGAQVFIAAHVPEAFTGMWSDMNDIGAGAVWTLSSSSLLNMIIGPVNYSKFLVPIALFILGLGVWTFFYSLKFRSLAMLCGSLAITLSTCFFAGACWGVASAEIAIGFNFFALALVVMNEGESRTFVRWARLMLAGLCVGVNVCEAADVGAMCSVLVALFIFYKSLVEASGTMIFRVVRGVSSVAMVACFAVFMALSTVIALVGTPGNVSISAQDKGAESQQVRQAQWDWATQWSLPKIETLGIVVPGLFGYRMDTPKDMEPMLRDKYTGGVYWGGVGRDPNIDRYFDSGGENTPGGLMRFGYAGYYCGVLVVLVGLWAIAQSFRRQNSIFTQLEKNLIRFWIFVMVASLLVAWGRFAPMFYGLLYQIPHFSDIRNPTKFLIFFCWALAVLFAYGVNALSRRYLESQPQSAKSAKAVPAPAIKKDAFEIRWGLFCIGLVVASAVGWVIYSGKKESLIHYIQKVGYPDEGFANAIATFSIAQVGSFVLLLTVAVGLIVAITSGYFSGPRSKMGALLLVAFLVIDLGRANLPFIIHWNYKEKYEVGSLNPVLDFLRDKPYEHRVAGFPFDPQSQLRAYDNYFGGSGIYRIEWTQHHFLYYGIQSLDVIQMPRMAGDLKEYQDALMPRGTAESAPLIARHWELTNTRYLLGAAGFLDAINQQLDPGKSRFRIVMRFDIVLKPGISQPSIPFRLEEFTAVTNKDGDLALFEFTGALPRAKLYSNWQVNTNDSVNLKTLADLSFDPGKTVLVSTPEPGLAPVSTTENSGTVDINRFNAKHLTFTTHAAVPSVLLINDRYDSGWRVTVDDKPVPMLRCNFIMRGVLVPAGEHKVDFNFSLPNPYFFVMLVAIGAGIVLCIYLFFATRKNRSAV